MGHSYQILEHVMPPSHDVFKIYAGGLCTSFGPAKQSGLYSNHEPLGQEKLVLRFHNTTASNLGSRATRSII